MNKLECYKPSTYNWTPSFGSAPSSYARVALIKLYDGWRVLVAGAADLRFERDYSEDECEDALRMYLTIQSWHTVEPEELKREGFQHG